MSRCTWTSWVERQAILFGGDGVLAGLQADLDVLPLLVRLGLELPAAHLDVRDRDLGSFDRLVIRIDDLPFDLPALCRRRDGDPRQAEGQRTSHEGPADGGARHNSSIRIRIAGLVYNDPPRRCG